MELKIITTAYDEYGDNSVTSYYIDNKVVTKEYYRDLTNNPNYHQDCFKTSIKNDSEGRIHTITNTSQLRKITA